jgi:signal transduction histidine kinase/DNA-binding response OmpR family regulator/ligand-binding sensor domain-containing protein
VVRSNPISSHRIVSLIIFILALGAFNQGVSAQSYSYEIQNIPLEGDFINFSGISFAQDHDGFMWFGSYDGLYRYQGTSVKVFRHLQDDEHSLSDNFVKDLLVDSEGVMWIGTLNGLNRFDRYTESFTRYQHNPNDTTSILPGEIRQIHEDDQSNIWIASNSGLSLFDRATETFQHFQIKHQQQTLIHSPQPIFGLYQNREDNLWLIAGEGVYRFHIPTGDTEKMHDISFQDEGSFTMNMFIDRSGRCWINSHRGLYLYDFQKKTIQQHILKQHNTEWIGDQYNRFMIEDSSGNYWVRTFEAIYCYNQELELKYCLEHSQPYPHTLRYQYLIWEMFVDHTGSIWFYSPDGIHQLIRKRENFRVYDSDSISGNRVRCIHVEDTDLIWFGTPWGFSSIDRGTNAVQMHYGSPWWVSAASYSARTMYLDKEHTLWMGMENMGLVSMVESGDGQWLFRRHIPDSVDSTRLDDYGLYNIVNIFEDTGGRLWIGVDSEDFLHYYDRKENKMIRLVDNPAAKNRLPERAMIRHQTGPDTLWALGSSGVYKIILPFTEISENQIMPEEIVKCQLVDNSGQHIDLSGSIRASYMDSSRIIWLGTSQGGLYKISLKSLPGLEAHENRIKTDNIRLGLPSYDARSILPDGKGHLWIGTGNGLAKLDIRSETFTSYFVRHGLPSNIFRINSSAIGDDGEMFFGTWDGMFSFYPDSIYTNQNTPPVKITGISINNQPQQPGKGNILTTSVTYMDKLELPHKKNNLSLEYAILNYFHPDLNQYKYKLEGLIDDWIYAGNRANVDFTNLDPGTYTFRVAGSNNDGVWNEEGASLQILIRPPPWQTWYAYVIYGLLLALIILRYRRFLINRAKLRFAVEVERIEKEKVQEIDQIKSRFFANISHEFRTPLTLIHGPLTDLEKQDTDTILMKREVLGIIKRNTTRLQNLINQLLDISRMETGTVKLQVSEGKLESFLRTIILSFLSLAESKKIKYNHQLPGSNLSLWYDADKLEKILINLISNAFKFTDEHGEIRILGEYVKNEGTGIPEYLSLTIADTGMGIPADKLDRIFDRFYKVNDSSEGLTEGTGIGLALTKELVELYRADIRVRSIEGKGTTFSLRIPVARDLFRDEERIIVSEESPDHIVEEPYQPSEIKPDPPEYKVEEKNKPVVLVVEDNPDMSQYIAGNLERRYRVVLAGNGKQGFELAVEHIPDLVISDLMMPVMDGMEMCGLIKEDERTSHIPVIMLTARADRDSKLGGLQTGADDYMIKPFDAEELQVRVKNLVDQRKHLREKFRKELITEPEGTTAISPEDRLLNKVLEIFTRHLDDPEFNIDRMSSSLNMSRTQLYRKIHAITGHTPRELLQTIRLKKAASLLESGERNISQVAYQVGFNNMSYFAKCFRRLYKVNPSEHLRSRN